MKKSAKLILAWMLALIPLLTLAACAKKEEPQLVGAPVEAENTEITEELKGYFDAATASLDMEYVPVKLISTQVVAGTNYKFLCTANGEEKYVTIYVDLDKNASVTEITDAE